MNIFLHLASSRRSIRKFEDKDIPLKDIEYFIKSAVSAPSGCNSQCWNFVAVRNRETIKQIETAVINKIEDILADKKFNLPDGYLNSKRKQICFFSNAPVVIVVFMTNAKFYDPILVSALRENGYNDEGIMKLLSNYDLLSIGAAIQNMLLAIHEKGYGACWMNEPTIAGKAVNEILGVPNEQKFISIVPVGFPSYIPRDKKMKDLDEVFSVV